MFKGIVELIAGIFIESELGMWLLIPLGLVAILIVPLGIMIIFMLPGGLFSAFIKFGLGAIFGDGFARVISGVFALISLIVFVGTVIEAFENSDFIYYSIWAFFFVFYNFIMAVTEMD